MHEYHSSPAREYKIEVKDRDMNQILVIGSLNMDVVVPVSYTHLTLPTI